MQFIWITTIILVLVSVFATTGRAYDDRDMELRDYDYMSRFFEKRAPMDRSSMVRFGKRAPMDRSAMVRFGKRAPMDRSAMVRFGKRTNNYNNY